MGSCENVTQTNRFFISDFQLTFQCHAKSRVADICKQNVTLGFSETSAVFLARALSDKHQTGTQESSLSGLDNLNDIGLQFWKGLKARFPVSLEVGVRLTYRISVLCQVLGCTWDTWFETFPLSLASDGAVGIQVWSWDPKRPG